MSRFCTACGTQLADETARFCFCGKCGAAVFAPPQSSVNLYFVMIPTHRNPNGSWSDFKWRRRFSRRHDEAITINVAILHGGYTFLPPSEGGWMNGPGNFQAEGMRPFLFTAESREKANIIADLVCIHYKQITVMAGIWAQEVEFRNRRELIPFFTDMLGESWMRRIRKELATKWFSWRTWF